MKLLRDRHGFYRVQRTVTQVSEPLKDLFDARAKAWAWEENTDAQPDMEVVVEDFSHRQSATKPLPPR